MNAATEVKRHKLTQEDCDTVRLLLARRRTLKEIAEIISVDPSTVGKIRLANYDLPTYLEQRKQMNKKTKENKQKAEKQKRMQIWDQDVHDEPPEVPGQMQMNLEPEKDPSPAAQDDTKSMMRFQAAMMDKLLNKLDELIVVLRGGAEA